MRARRKKQVAPRSWQFRIPIVIHQQRRDLRRVGAAAHLSSADLLRETRKLSLLRRMKTLCFSQPTEPTLLRPVAMPLPDVTCLQCVGLVTNRYCHLVRAPWFSSVVALGRVQGRSVVKRGREHISSSWYVALMWSSCSVFTQLFREDDLKDTYVFSFKCKTLLLSSHEQRKASYVYEKK